MQFICYPPCTTCQKARQWLDARNIAYEFRNIKEVNPKLCDELKRWHERKRAAAEAVFQHERAILYKQLGLAQKLPSIGEEE